MWKTQQKEVKVLGWIMNLFSPVWAFTSPALWLTSLTLAFTYHTAARKIPGRQFAALFIPIVWIVRLNLCLISKQISTVLDEIEVNVVKQNGMEEFYCLNQQVLQTKWQNTVVSLSNRPILVYSGLMPLSAWQRCQLFSDLPSPWLHFEYV